MSELASDPATILIVDDTPANLNVLSTILSQEGYKVRPANGGEVALVVAQHASPDLILLDIQMPGMNGFEVCKRLQQQEQTRDIPVIFISALDEVLDKVEAFEVGGADYITKPFQILEVLARIEHQLKLRRQHKQLAAVNQLARDLQGTAGRLVGYATTLAEHEQAPPAQSATDLHDAATGIATGLAELIRLSEQPGAQV
jgi:DNA-binding response OmpR family regulator